MSNFLSHEPRDSQQREVPNHEAQAQPRLPRSKNGAACPNPVLVSQVLWTLTSPLLQAKLRMSAFDFTCHVLAYDGASPAALEHRLIFRGTTGHCLRSSQGLHPVSDLYSCWCAGGPRTTEPSSYPTPTGTVARPSETGTQAVLDARSPLEASLASRFVPSESPFAAPAYSAGTTPILSWVFPSLGRSPPRP